MHNHDDKSDLFTRERALEIFGRVEAAARASGVRDVELLLEIHRSALTRFANNEIHQNVASQRCNISVRCLADGKTARAATNRLDADSVRRVVENAVALTRSQIADPTLLPLTEPAASSLEAPPARWFLSAAGTRPADRAKVVAHAIAIAKSAGQTAAGIFSTDDSFTGIYNSRGLALDHPETMARFSITSMGANSSGWAKSSACDPTALDPLALAHSAVEKARASESLSELPAGRYTVILEPAAVLDLVGQMFADFSGTALHDERSFLTGRLGKQLFQNGIDITDDVFHPLQSGPAFDGEGVPRKRLNLVANGAVTEVAYSRRAAGVAHATPTGHGFPLPNDLGEGPVNIVFAGGGATLADMIASTERGILVTRFWYIREVDPYAKIMTGMTRDGTFEIRDGKVAHGIRNLRFNQSLIELLNSVESLGPAIRCSGEEAIDMVVPAMKARNFNFTEVTRY